ncbi:NADH-ubiquinone oxidoreductase 14.8 kDa subunit [Hirsutella minnesotensis 3608]|nr:NADH-ubiquinone oxidoreductase 14.8 kDa subunit [Hirsutella minnesotensis 3608]
MAITPTQFAKKTAQCNWADAKRRVLSSYREWIRAAPEIQTMYNMPMPISTIRTRMRQEFEKQRFVAKLPVVDVLIFKSHAEYQARADSGSAQEMMNFWKQTTHVMSYFKEENFRAEKRLPSSFMTGFLEANRVGIEMGSQPDLCTYPFSFPGTFQSIAIQRRSVP